MTDKNEATENEDSAIDEVSQDTQEKTNFNDDSKPPLKT